MQSVVDVLNEIGNFVASVPNEIWLTMLGGLLVAPVAQLVKAVNKVRSSGRMVGVVTAVSVLFSFVVYLFDTNPNHPWVIAIQTGAVYLASQPFYFKLVKPLSAAIAEQIAKAAAFDAQIKSAAEPQLTASPDFSQ